jgi:hypothetical protein
VDGCADRFGDWSAKDLLCHLAIWQRIAGAKLEARRQGREATASDMLGEPLDEAESARLMALPIDPTNAYFQERYRDLTWKEAHRFWSESRNLVNAEVEKLSDADFPEGETLSTEIGVDSFQHVRVHLDG